VRGLDFSSAGEAAGRIKRALQQIGVPSAVIRRAAIVAYEAEMNIVIHARQGTLRASISPGRIELIAEDEGPGIADIEQAMQEGFSTAPDHIREMGFGAGMGLSNIKRCSSQMTIVSDVGRGTKVTAILTGW
jgi:anti-sigma regulatory factor (Ser/Thr protein kinase)